VGHGVPCQGQQVDAIHFRIYRVYVMVREIDADWMSTIEAAEALGLTSDRVRQLVASGGLRSRRVGGRYLVRRDDVEARIDAGAPSGRPFSPRRAWALVLLEEGVTPTGLDSVTLSKLRAVLRDRSLWAIRSRLGSRAERRDLRAHSSDLDRLESEEGVILTGGRHAREAGLGLVASDAMVELYVDRPTADRLAARYALRPSERPNVRLRVLPPGVAGWLGVRIAPRLAVALDLAEDRDPRAQAAAREALERR
jgi:excisionase family DNA binding protein